MLLGTSGRKGNIKTLGILGSLQEIISTIVVFQNVLPSVISFRLPGSPAEVFRAGFTAMFYSENFGG